MARQDHSGNIGCNHCGKQEKNYFLFPLFENDSQSQFCLLYPRFPVVVWDKGRPEKTATATFTASMVRNENEPQWDQSEYRVEITDRYGLGQEVVRVHAQDGDNVRYDIIFWQGLQDTILY